MLPLDKDTAEALRGAPALVIATVALMQEMTRVLTAEIDVVAQRKTKEHPSLLKHKQRLAADYRSNLRSFAANPEMLKTLPDEAKTSIRAVAKRLALALEANARTLRAATDATRQLIQNIMTMIRKEVTPQQPYKNLAKPHMLRGNHKSVCRPVAVRQTV